MDVTLEQVAGQIADISKQLTGIEAKLTDVVEAKLATAVTQLKHQAVLNMEELKTEVKFAAEGYGATLQGIQRELEDLNKKVDIKFDDHDFALADHNRRIVKLEKRR